jgi:hypothetical protein
MISFKRIPIWFFILNSTFSWCNIWSIQIVKQKLLYGKYRTCLDWLIRTYQLVNILRDCLGELIEIFSFIFISFPIITYENILKKNTFESTLTLSFVIKIVIYKHLCYKRIIKLYIQTTS